jgi:Protein of unknown function (DUF3987)
VGKKDLSEVVRELGREPVRVAIHNQLAEQQGKTAMARNGTTSGNQTHRRFKDDRQTEYSPSDVQRFPIEALPDPIRSFAEALSDAVRVPLELAAISVLATCSASLGKGLSASSGPNDLIRGNLYLLGSAESGTGKSRTFRHAAAPILDFEKARLDYWSEIKHPELAAELRVLKREATSLENQLAGKKKNAQPDRDLIKSQLQGKLKRIHEVEDQLHPPRIIIEDATSEAVTLMLRNNQEQAFSLSADAGKVIQNIEGRYLKDRSVDDSIYLKGYSGDPHTVDRTTRPSIHLQSPCLTILWLTQPDKVGRLLENESLQAGGFLPRFLLCDTRAIPTEIPEFESPISADIKERYENLVRLLLSTYWEASDPVTIPDSPEAEKILREFHNRLVVRRLGDLRDVNSFLARWHEQAWRMAVVLHAVEHGSRAHLEPISEKTALDAVALAEWFGSEQLRLLRGTREERDEKRLDRLVDLLRSRYPGQASLRDLHLRNGFAAEEVRELAAKFPTSLKLENTQTGIRGGRPSEVAKLIQRAAYEPTKPTKPSRLAPSSGVS